MSGHGVFAVDRGIWDHPLFRQAELTEREAFLWLVSEAAFKSRRVRLGSTVVQLERGQVAHSLRFMATKWIWKEPRVRRFLARLKSDAMIDARTDAGQTIITICNYGKYQWPNGDADADTDAPRDAGATQERRKEEECNNDLKKTTPPAAASFECGGAAAEGGTAPRPKPSRSFAPRAYTAAFEAFWAAYPKTRTTNPKADASTFGSGSRQMIKQGRRQVSRGSPSTAGRNGRDISRPALRCISASAASMISRQLRLRRSTARSSALG